MIKIIHNYFCGSYSIVVLIHKFEGFVVCSAKVSASASTMKMFFSFGLVLSLSLLPFLFFSLPHPQTHTILLHAEFEIKFQKLSQHNIYPHRNGNIFIQHTRSRSRSLNFSSRSAFDCWSVYSFTHPWNPFIHKNNTAKWRRKSNFIPSCISSCSTFEKQFALLVSRINGICLPNSNTKRLRLIASHAAITNHMK